ncbi:helix-turn-helix domain-containing protein [Rhodococcus ruber]|uniref:helix-turn-helix domain-containing protein n=1 Tax=Rhodococcus ruber TaxID=1830 RepID=UPI00265D6789|nr:GAF domain-containing protein [Rhodococcus ruber]MDO1481866.1 GAF domain-containing protein [Rhodococcus ruber]
MDATTHLLELVLAGRGREEFDTLLVNAIESNPSERDALRRHQELALRIREQIMFQRSREAELSALNETAIDLNEIRDLHEILTAIVRRARRLLHADMTYLSLNDEEAGASYMKVTDGALTSEFRQLRLPLGTGLLGLVAQDGEPHFTEDYQRDSRFRHHQDIDDAVGAEQIRAILGVPLTVGGRVIGALLAVHRRVRRFPSNEVALLSAFAAHAAVALESARLLDEARTALTAVDAANTQLRAQNEAIELAELAHDELTGVLSEGGDIEQVAAVLSKVLGGVVDVYDEDGQLLVGSSATQIAEGFREAIIETKGGGRCMSAGPDVWFSRAAAANQHLGTLVLTRDSPLSPAEERTMERGAVVAALVLLFRRTEVEADQKVRGDLLTDMLARRSLDVARLRELARRQGVDLDAELSIAVVRPLEGARSEGQALRSAAALASELRGLGGIYGGSVVVLAPFPPLELGEQAMRRFDGATVGVASCGRGPEGIWEGWRDAEQTLTALLSLGRFGEVCDAAGLGLTRLLLGHNGGPELGEFVERTLGPLDEHDRRRGTELVETVESWFATGCVVRETASRMHVHPNTIVQRLDRVGALLGAGWRNPERRIDVQVALRLRRLQKVEFDLHDR